MPHGFGAFQLVTLACLGVMGIGRAVQLRGLGINVLPSTAGKPLGRVALEKTFGLCFMLWVYEIVAYAWPLGFHVFPSPLDAVLADVAAVKVLGVVVLIAALAIYGLGLVALGDAWRLGIDPAAPGALVTGGIFAWSRNPIYVALNLYAIGTFLLLGRLLFLLAALGLAGYLQYQIRQEEAFLERTFGDAYREYCARVGRYCTWK